MRLALLAAALLLAGCSAVPEGSYRDPSATFAVTTRFEASKFAGEWFVREWFPEDPRIGGFAFDFKAGAASVSIADGDGTDTPGYVEEVWPLSVPRQGLLHLANRGEVRDLAVLWVSEDFTVAALGAFDGTRGYIVARRDRGRPDTIAAAREILAFNGFRISNLERYE